jgi:hypothetical protein
LITSIFLLDIRDLRLDAFEGLARVSALSLTWRSAWLGGC